MLIKKEEYEVFCALLPLFQIDLTNVRLYQVPEPYHTDVCDVIIRTFHVLIKADTVRDNVLLQNIISFIVSFVIITHYDD